MGDYPPMEMEAEFKFGKHIGSTIEAVIENDPSYIRWATDGGVITLENEAYKAYEIAIEEYDFNKDHK